MNPYSPDVTQTHSTSAPSNYNSCFAIVAFLAYVAFMMINRGAARVLDEYAQSSTHGAIEVGIIICISGATSWLVAMKLHSQIPTIGMIVSRVIGGLAFGVAFVTCQPFLFPYVSGAVGFLVKRTPLEFIGILFDVIFQEQPYVLLPTIVFAAVTAWAAERVFRCIWPRPKTMNKAMELSRVS